MGDIQDIQWLPAPEDKDYPAAASYLGLLLPDAKVQALVRQMQAAPMAKFKAKDIFRASGLALLGVSNTHLEKDRKKIQEGKPLSPILLLRDPDHGKVVVADGYHRLCAAYSFSEDLWIPCKIV
jgi:hypothetical protein